MAGPTLQQLQQSYPGANLGQLQYFQEVFPSASKAATRTGVPVDVLLIQSGIETGWGTSPAFLQRNNPAGIGITGPNVTGNVYSSLDAGFADYADKLLGHGEAGQEQFAADVKAGATTRTLLQDLQAGGPGPHWAAGHYGGHTLTDTLDSILGKGASGQSATSHPGASPGDVVSTVVDAGKQAAEQLNLDPLGLLEGLTWPAQLARAFLGLFTNWRYLVEVFIGVGLMGAGTVLILRDIGLAAKPSDVAGAAKTAAVAA
jgi:hypothetical protein